MYFASTQTFPPNFLEESVDGTIRQPAAFLMMLRLNKKISFKRVSIFSCQKTNAMLQALHSVMLTNCVWSNCRTELGISRQNRSSKWQNRKMKQFVWLNKHHCVQRKERKFGKIWRSRKIEMKLFCFPFQKSTLSHEQLPQNHFSELVLIKTNFLFNPDSTWRQAELLFCCFNLRKLPSFQLSVCGKSSHDNQWVKPLETRC